MVYKMEKVCVVLIAVIIALPTCPGVRNVVESYTKCTFKLLRLRTVM